MTDGQSKTSKLSSKTFLDRPEKWFKKTFSRPHSRSPSPQPPSASTQENRGEEQSSVQHSAHRMMTSIQSLGSMSISSSPGVTGSTIAQGYQVQHSTSTKDSVTSASSTQLHGSVSDRSVTHTDPEKSPIHALSTAKDIAGVAWNFTEMLLKRLPTVVDPNPVKIAAGLVNIVLEIKNAVKGNIDAVEQRIISTVEQLDTVEKALAGWQPDKVEEVQGMKLYQTILQNEWIKLIALKNQSIVRKIAVHEQDKGKIADIFDRINQAREQLVVVTGLRVHKTIVAIQDDVAKLLLERLEASHAADHKFELEGEQRQLLRRAVCTPGTRVRILNGIVRWANDTSPQCQSVYWLSGQAGAGKSTIAYTIARRFEFAGDADDTIILGGNFFCSRQINEAKSATRIIRTIVYHLALKSKPFADALRTSGKFDTIRHGVRAQLEGLLIEPWKQALSASNPLRFLLVIDALDEIDGMGGSEFLRDLLDVINKHSLPGLKFFVTSRPDPNLVAHLSSFEDKQAYRLEQVSSAEAEDDIATYLNTNLPAFVGRPEMAKLVNQAAGLFIYAATVVKHLAGRTPLEQKRRLATLPFIPGSANQQTSEDSETPLLDGLYLQILSDAFRIFKGDERTERLQILHTFLCSAERISTSVASELLSPSSIEDDPVFSPAAIADDVLAHLHAVLYKENNKIFSYHKSFPDFIFNRNRAKDFSCDEAQHHHHLTTSCFRVMNKLKFNIANIESSFGLDANNSALPEAVKHNIPPILSYSCQNWGYHLSGVELIDSSNLCDTLSTFLQLRVLFWIEAMNLLGSCGQCEWILQNAHKWVPYDNFVLREELAEAASFALYFCGSGATLSTPHLYISALATWPRISSLHQEWKKYFPSIPKFTNVLFNEKPLMSIEAGSPIWTVAISRDDKFIVSGSSDALIRVWDASTGNMLRVLEGHSKGVRSIAFSSDDKCIVSGSADESVRMWDISTGKMLQVLEGHTNAVFSVAFSSDDKYIVSGSADQSVRVWDITSGQMLQVLEDDTGDGWSTTSSDDYSAFGNVSDGIIMRLWDAPTGEGLKAIEGYTNGVWSVAFSRNSKFIVSGSSDQFVKIWDASTGEVLRILEGHTAPVWSVSFSSDDKQIVSGSSDRSVRVWDVSTGKILKVLEGHTSDVWSVAFSNNNKHIVSGSYDQSVLVWDVATGKLLKTMEGHTDDVYSVTFSSNDKHIVSGSLDKLVQVWDASIDKMLKKEQGHSGTVLSVTFSHDDRYIVSGSSDSLVRVWDASSGTIVKMLEGHTKGVQSVALSSDDKYILSGSYDTSIRIWDAFTGKVLKVLEGHTDVVWSVAFSSNDKWIVSGSFDKLICVWDVSTGQMLKMLEGHKEFVRTVAFSKNNKQILSCSFDKSVRLWDASTGKVLRIIKADNDDVWSVALSRDDKFIVSGSSDQLIRLWDTSTGKVLKVLEGHTGPVWSVAFASDDKQIVSGSSDNSVRVWDASTGKVLRILEGHTRGIHSVGFSSNNTYVVSGSSDQSARMWALSTPVTPQIPYHYYVCQKMTDISGNQKNSGWLVSQSNINHYLMFVPLSANLSDSSNILTLPQTHAPSVDFTSSTLGSQWGNCFSP